MLKSKRTNKANYQEGIKANLDKMMNTTDKLMFVDVNGYYHVVMCTEQSDNTVLMYDTVLNDDNTTDVTEQVSYATMEEANKEAKLYVTDITTNYNPAKHMI